MNHNYPKSFKDLISPIKKEIFITILLSALGAMSLLISPIAVTISVNKYLNGSVDSFLYWIIIAALGLVFKQILHTISVGYAHVVEAKFRYQLRKDFSDKLSRLPLGFFSENTSGTIRKLISEDTINIHTIIAHMISDLTSGILLPILCIIVMLIVEWHTAIIIILFTFLILVIGMIWTSINSRGIEEINERYEKAQRDMSHASIEMIDGIKEVKNFGLTDSLFKRFDNALKRFIQTSYEWLNSTSKPMAFIMAAIQPTIMLLVSISACIFSIKNSWLSPEYTILFLLMAITLPSSLINTMQLSNFIRIGRHSVNVLLDLYSESDQKFVENPKEFAIGDIEFKNVSFEYEDENEVLKNIDCKIESGKITALVGPSGSGKTTMIRLIARFWDINKGEITIGGINVKDFSEREMLSNIALVFQDIALINASIYENIALSKPNATKAEIIAAAKSAYIHDRIMQLPNGYDSIYGDENIILSGGEKQRVTIARAFLADAPIVLLDEATAQADAESEFEIQKALSKLSKDKTVVIIAHRLTSVVNADQILVFENGKIIERGSHNQLINKEGLYQKMWKAQNIDRGEYNGTI
ncbi:MAG: ABC transporter ATP-binding protein [Tissierellia bacterium]|nr:ABC transporter ATP-binding protein [Tissierellia bacterium]